MTEDQINGKLLRNMKLEEALTLSQIVNNISKAYNNARDFYSRNYDIIEECEKKATYLLKQVLDDLLEDGK